jgi:hypothetical protein
MAFFPYRYMRFVIGPNECFKSKPKFFMAWRFGAPPTTMYTCEIEVERGLKHRGGGGWYLDMPKGTIPYEEASFHKECVVKQAASDVGATSIELPPHDDLEQAKLIVSQVAIVMAQAIFASMVGPKRRKGKGTKRNEVDPNVGDFPIGAHGGSLQIVPII